MIPASQAHGLPGADDDRIFSDLLASSTPYHPFIDAGLQDFNRSSDSTSTDPGSADNAAAIERFRSQQPELSALLVSLTVQCYYRDDRVMASLGMAPRPPFPEGFELESGDWSLLDPVRARGPIWRKTND